MSADFFAAAAATAHFPMRIGAARKIVCTSYYQAKVPPLLPAECFLRETGFMGQFHFASIRINLIFLVARCR